MSITIFPYNSSSSNSSLTAAQLAAINSIGNLQIQVNAATPSNIGNTIMKRDAFGDFNFTSSTGASLSISSISGNTGMFNSLIVNNFSPMQLSVNSISGNTGVFNSIAVNSITGSSGNFNNLIVKNLSTTNISVNSITGSSGTFNSITVNSMTGFVGTFNTLTAITMNSAVMNVETLQIKGQTGGYCLIEVHPVTNTYSLVLPTGAPNSAGLSFVSADSFGDLIWACPSEPYAIYQSNGTTNLSTNTFNNFSDLAAYLYNINNTGICTIYFDATYSGGTCNITAGSYNLPPTVKMVGIQNASLQLFGNVIFNFPNAMAALEFRNINVFADGTATTPWITCSSISANVNTITLINTNITNQGSFNGEMITLQTTNVYLYQNSVIGGTSGSLGFCLSRGVGAAIEMDGTSALVLGAIDLRTPLSLSIDILAAPGSNFDPTILSSLSYTPYNPDTCSQIKMYDNSGGTSNSVTINPHNGTSNYTLTLPSSNATGTLSNNGAGVLSWVPVSSGSAVSSVSNSDSSLIFSPTTGSVIGSLNLNNANTWTANQQVKGLLSGGSIATGYIGEIRTSNIPLASAITLGSNSI